LDGELASAHAPQSVVLTLEDETDLSRGEMIASVADAPHRTRHFEATVVWMHAKPLSPGATYLLKHTTQTVRAQVIEIRSRIDVENLEEPATDRLALNDIGKVVIETSRPLLADLYRENRTTGSFILIDPADNATAGAGMIRSISDADESASAAKRVLRGVVVVGKRLQLASQIESSLLQDGALVLRTRAGISPSLLTIARLGAVVLVESDEIGPVALTAVNGADTGPRELAFDDAEEILDELRRVAALPLGDDSNVYGLGI
jgi:hypothetical protein